MKKLVALLLLIAMLSLASCEYLPDELSELITSQRMQTVSFTAGYDYGFHQKDQATLLLGGSNIFFDPDEWDIGRINAGDVINVEYRGELLVQETYPGTVITKNAEIISISVQRADVIELTVTGVTDDLTLVPKDGSSTALIPTDPGTETTMIVSADGSFRQLWDGHLGTPIYATGKYSGDSFEVRAYYGFDPRVSK